MVCPLQIGTARGDDLSAPAYILEEDPLIRIRDSDLKLDNVRRSQFYLHSGEVFASAEPTRVTTVLGSCVAVCLFDSLAEVGGINHYLLPAGAEPSPRFGSHAILQLIDDVLERGARRSGLRAKVFGGASVLASGGRRNIGADNIELALSTLEREQISVLDQDVGGFCGRKLVFDTDVGVAWVRSL
jgi:chemotaxis protein CheD